MPANKSNRTKATKPHVVSPDGSEDEHVVTVGGSTLLEAIDAYESEHDQEVQDGQQDDISDGSDAIVVTEVKSIKTRSSNGITKKRHLKDAATLSDGEDLDIHSSPKKPKTSSASNSRKRQEHVEVTNNTGDTKIDESDIYQSDISVSMSPLKLATVSPRKRGTVVDVVGDDDNTRSKGKQKLSAKPSNKSPHKAGSTINTGRASRAFDDDDVFSNVSSSRVPSLLPGVSTLTPTKASRSFKDVVPTVRTFKSVVPPSPTTRIVSNGATLDEDGLKYTISTLPSECEVTHVSLQDRLLEDDYLLLPKLTSGTLISWSSASSATSAPMNLVAFSEWANQCPELNYDIACAAIGFTRYKNFINPSRISPRDVNILYTSHDKKKSILQCNYKTAICLSPILSCDSFLTTATSTGLRNKYLSGHFHKQEWQRFEAFACMVFDRRVMVAQIHSEAISFMTMGVFKDREHVSPSKFPRNPAILSSSVSAGPATNYSSTRFKPVLDVYDDIPVYDSRNHPFNFTTDLDDLSSTLPLFKGEIPYASFVVVGYTLGHYDNLKDNRATLTTNILFAILIATE